ncbi:MAG: sulfatase-like hydrolase/transferase [Halobacteriaceae archaeon]
MSQRVRDGDRDPPNVLLVTTDQQRYDVSAGECPLGVGVETPAIDRLRAEGTWFERAYTPIAICSPARCSLLTGLYPHNHGVLSNPTRPGGVTVDLDPDLPTFGERLADAGYAASYVGKWHVGTDQTPEDFGFEFLAPGSHGAVLDDPDYREHAREHGVDLEAFEPEATGAPGGAATNPMPVEATQTHYLVDRTIEALERHVESGERFCHRLDVPGPHAPYVVPEPYASMYDPADLDPWPSFADTFDGKPAVHEIHPEYYGVDGLDWEEWAPAVAKYLGFVTFVSAEVDRLLDAVDDLGLTEDTLVVRTADHGDFCGGHRQMDKGPMAYEDITRIPLAVRWPGEVAAGRTTDAFAHLHDLMPTFCDVAGADVPDVDGRSLVPVFDGEAPADWYDAAYFEYHGEPETLYTQRGLRSDRYKFVFNGPDRNELYDLEADPHELTNLVDHPEYADVRAALAERLGDWMAATDDTVHLGRYRRRCT